jgi:hypothetical protein
MTNRRALGVLLAGVVIAATCGAFAAVQFIGTVHSAVPQRVPGRFQVTLASGRWDLYQLTGITSGTSVGGVSVTETNQQAPTIDSSMLTVTGAGGRQLPVQNWSGNGVETLQLGSDLYTGVVSFRAPGPARYAVTVDSPGPAEVVIARPVLSVFEDALPWLAGALAGGLCFVVGLIMLIVIHRRNPRRTSPPGASPQSP